MKKVVIIFLLALGLTSTVSGQTFTEACLIPQNDKFNHSCPDQYCVDLDELVKKANGEDVYVRGINEATNQVEFLKYGELAQVKNGCLGIYEPYMGTIFIIRCEDGIILEFFSGACANK